MHTAKKIKTIFWLIGGIGTVLVGLLMISGFSIRKGGPEFDPDWREKLLQYRQEKDQEFKTSATSPMAGVKWLRVSAGKKVYVSEYNGKVTLTENSEPGVKLSLMGLAGKWTWENLDMAITCRIGDCMVPGGHELPGRVEFKIGRLTLTANPGDDNLTLIVFDPQRPNITRFKGLVYFPPDPALAVTAQFEKLNDLIPVKLVTSRNLEKTYYRYGKIEFSLEGRDLSLTAFASSKQLKSDSKVLFIPFMDRSNDDETYGAGRYLEIPEPVEKVFKLDFNYCFNPLCNYSPAYNCSIPPAENILPVAIPAGEKTYPYH